MSFNYSANWSFGRNSPTKAVDAAYRLPFPGDQTFDVINTAARPHTGLIDRHAIDVLMPAGTPVIAARSGIVFDVKGQRGGDAIADGAVPMHYKDQDAMGNYVRVWHDDGTFAEYAQLADDSVTVAPGEFVRAGTQIALSGASGAAKQPHLHFGVLKPMGGLAPPSSMSLRFDLGPDGFVSPTFGEPLGVADPVRVSPDVATRDPLIIAGGSKEQADGRTGVIHSDIKPQNFKLWVPPLGAVLTIIGGLICMLIIGYRKGSGPLHVIASALLRWYRAARAPRQPTAKADEIENSDDIDAAESSASPEVRHFRPAPGFLIADWEASVHSQLGLALPPDCAIHAKVAVDRLVARPATLRQDPELFSKMRSESVDFLIVRVSDNRILAAIDVVSARGAPAQREKLRAIKRSVLARAGIPLEVIDANVGPDALRQILAPLVRFSTRGGRRKA